MSDPNATCFSDDGMCGGNRTALPSPQLLPLVAALSTVSLATVGLNVLVLYAVRVERKLHTVGNLYIVSLSAADLLVGTVVMPMNILYLLTCRWTLGRPLCLFWLSMDYVASTASIFSVFILCIDRYRSVREPLGYLRYRTKAQASATILGAWALSFLWVVPIVGWRHFSASHPQPQEGRCETDFFHVTWFKILTAAVNFYLPTLLMLWFYARIYRAVRRHCQHRQLAGGSQSFFPPGLEASGRPGRGSPWQALKRRPRDTAGAAEPPPPVPGRPLDTPGQEEPGLPLDVMCPRPPDVSPGDASPRSQEAGETEGRRTSDSSSEAATLGLGPSYSGSDSDAAEPARAKPRSLSLDLVKATWRRLRSHSRQYLAGLPLSRERKAAKQLGCIMAAFILCWIPYFVFFMVVAFCERCASERVHMVTIWLGYLNSTLNPFIYPLCNDSFRKTFKRILRLPS